MTVQKEGLRSVNRKIAFYNLDIRKFNSQYQPIELDKYKKSHDRFLIIDNEEIYHIGASLKDLGKKLFAFSKMYINIRKLLLKLETNE